MITSIISGAILVLCVLGYLLPSSTTFGSPKMKGEAAFSNLPALLNLSITSASRSLHSGEFTSVELVKAYLARIEEASHFKAVLQVNPDVLQEAQTLDLERLRTGARGPLHGVPILVKDNIATKDRLDASAGSFALLGAKPAHESSLVARLRASGVLILGKTNLSEWANFRGLDITGGWSPRGGQTLGAYHANATPDGSSAGSAVATALGLCTAALGTETTGSIVGPAEKNNVVGFKPTRALVANDGTIPISRRQDVIGTLSQTVKDAAYLLSHMAGRSDLDERTWQIPFDKIPDYTTFCTGTDLTGITIGVPRNAIPPDEQKPEIMSSFEAALAMFESAGAKVVDNANFPAGEEFQKLDQQVKGVVRSSEFRRDMAHYLDTLADNPNDLHSVEDLIQFTKTHPAEDFPRCDIGKFLWTQEKDVDVGSDKYAGMVKDELFYGGEGGILGAMTKFHLDVLVVPSEFGYANDLAAKMGFPVISVPLGFWPEGTPIEMEDDLVVVGPGMPYSIQIMTKAFSDGVLLQVAHAFEQLSAVREKGPAPHRAPKTELADVRAVAQKM